jgi:hypothetical protein
MGFSSSPELFCPMCDNQLLKSQKGEKLAKFVVEQSASLAHPFPSKDATGMWQ